LTSPKLVLRFFKKEKDSMELDSEEVSILLTSLATHMLLVVASRNSTVAGTLGLFVLFHTPLLEYGASCTSMTGLTQIQDVKQDLISTCTLVLLEEWPEEFLVTHSR
jgi:hypothetical protein